MLAFRNRFHGHGSLRYVYRNGRAVRTHTITVKYSPNPRRSTPRFTVVISKKVLKSAVGRNRIRRRVYEVIRHELPLISPKNDVVVLIFSAEIRELPFSELHSQLKEIFSNAGLYKKVE